MGETKINEDRFAEVISKPLLSGSHEPNGKMCVIEAAAYISGEPWSDHPECVCPTIGAFMRSWNDALPNADRDRLLKPLLRPVIGTAGSDGLATRRSFLAGDWLVRVQIPEWISLTEKLQPHAEKLRSLEEIVDKRSLAAAEKILPVVRAAAKGCSAVRVAYWQAARRAGWDSACYASPAMTWSADTWYVARRAASAALEPTIRKLQEGAADLVLRMCELGSER